MISDIAKKRRTVRRFSEKPVSMEQIKKVLEVASQAPSGANYQPWRFLIVDDPELKKQIRDASEEGEKEFYKNLKGDWAQWLESKDINWQKPYLQKVPVLLVVLGQNAVPYSKESVWLSIGYMLLAIEELGLGTVPYTPSAPDKVLAELDTPKGFRLEAILPIGYPDDDKHKEDRLKVEDIYRLNAWCDNG